MKNFKIFIIFFLTLLFIPANAKDKFIGKWINENTKSVFEIVKEENQYKMYIIYSGRFFKEFQNELDGIFMKKNVSYKGTSTFIDSDYNEFDVKASYKIRKGELVIKAKGQSPFTNEKFKSKTILTKFKDDDEFTKGENLFGIQIGDNIKNYKILTRINLGNDMIGFREGIVIEAPDPNKDFETYIVQTVKDTDQIYRISAYHKANRNKLSWGRCEALMQPFRNFIFEKYSEKYTPMDEKMLTLGGKITDSTTTFALVDKKTNIYNYELWTSCDEPFSNSIGDKGQYIARISILHNGLMKLSWAKERKNKNRKKKKF